MFIIYQSPDRLHSLGSVKFPQGVYCPVTYRGFRITQNLHQFWHCSPIPDIAQYTGRTEAGIRIFAGQ